LRKIILVVVSVVAVAIVGGLVYNSLTGKSDTERKLADMEKRLQQLSSGSNQPPTASTQTVIIGGAGTQDSSIVAQQERINGVMKQGFLYLNKRDLKSADLAARIFQEGIDKVDAKQAQFYHGLGRALLMLGKDAEALAAFTTGRALDGTIGDLISGQGRAYWAMQDYYHAKLAFEDAVKVAPTSVDAWSVLAWVYLGLKERDKAIEGFRILIAQDATNKDWIMGLNLARGSNFDYGQIRRIYDLPAVEKFAAPTSQPATNH